jgi:hypothetical protein
MKGERTADSQGIAAILLLSSFVIGLTGIGLLASYAASAAYYHVSVFYPALYAEP